MAKYKFTKTYRFSEGICVDADGTVTPIPIPLANQPSTKIAVHVSSRKAEHELFRKSVNKKKKPFTQREEKRSVSAWDNNSCVPQRYEKKSFPVASSRPKPITTVTLNDRSNPYYSENLRNKNLNIDQRIRGAFGGVHILKPINRIAAGSFKKR